MNRQPVSRLATPLLLISLMCALIGAPAAAQMTQEERDEWFANKLVGAKLEGQFNISSPQGTSAPQTDNYAVSELEKGPDGTWIFNYTMSYGSGPDGPKLTVPIPVEVVWAGDTPMLTMTEQEVEGFGKFSVRILIHKDWYAGTWDNGSVGGHMWGQIKKD